MSKAKKVTRSGATGRLVTASPSGAIFHERVAHPVSGTFLKSLKDDGVSSGTIDSTKRSAKRKIAKQADAKR